MLAQRYLPLALTLALCACGPARSAPPPEPSGHHARRHARADEKAQPAAPAEIRFRLCTLQPSSVRGLRTVAAVRRAGEPDTFAILAGRRVPLRKALGDARVAGQTRWFRARHSLQVPLGRGREPRYFAIYDVGRIIEGGQLAYLGMVDRLPVFAAAEDVAPVRAELTRSLQTQTDLPRLLAASARLRASFQALEVVYVPLRRSGCVFQALVPVTNPAPRSSARAAAGATGRSAR